jgi:MoaA/NifB/PqqE/SkfB family radical SAM enzyme
LDVNFIDAPTNVVINDAITLPKTFCFSPWAHLEISSQGEFKPCCVYKESITDSNGIAYNINNINIEEVYNSDYLNNLRKDFLAGSKPGGCENCWYKEQQGGESNRTWTKKHLGIEAECLNIEQDSITNLISLDIKLGNLCNFKCRICNANSSSKIAEEQIKHFGSMLDLKTLNRQGQWIENKQIWKMFNVLGNQLINIDFYGGEPFLNKQQEIFLDYLIYNDYAKKIRLHYNSNGSVYPEHLFDKWKLFKQVDIAFSIDNIGQRFELERGGSWTQVEQNLDKFLSSKPSNMIVSIFATVNVQNIYYLDQLIEWVEPRNFNALVWNMLQHPNYLSITSMNQELTTKVINKLNQIDQKKLLTYNILPIIELLKQNKCSLNSVDQLAEYMLKLDNIRQQKFNQTHSEIASIIYKGKLTWENHLM